MMNLFSGDRRGEVQQRREVEASGGLPAQPLFGGGSTAGGCPAPIVLAEGSRYIAITPQPSGGTEPVALRVTSPNYAGVDHYVTAGGELACGAVSQTPDAWGTVHLRGLLIVPSTPYSIQSDCGGGLLSAPVTVTTWRYGDVNNTNVVNIDDILCVLNGFDGNFGTCSRYADDQLPFHPNEVVNLNDILAVLAAFFGATYPGPLPPTTPIIASPVLNTHATMVNTTPIALTGTAPGAVAVEYANHFGVFPATLGAGGSFSASVVLAENRVNPIYFTAIDECGRRSAPILTTITHDSEPPQVFIDFPANDASVTLTHTDVAGRVGDMLSGFMGLTVKVTCPACPPEGINAIVDVGLGNNGTFNAPNVPLDLGPNVITATAADALGNQASKQITVTRIVIPPNTPQMMVVSGNGQSAPVHQFLPQPITVKVLKANGDPFVNKVVTFKVTRSDGRLVGEMAANCYGDGTMMLQCHTDADGEVRAMWKLGSDAGCGNNRVEVTSTSIAGTVAFCASAMPGPASQINIGSGNNQRVEVNAQAPEPLRARVSDSCNGIANLGVTFTVIQGGGKVRAVGTTTWLDEVTVPTAVTGHATVEYFAGPNKGNQLVEANFTGNLTNPATFVTYALERDENQPTSLSGLVFDNALQPIGGAEVKLVLAGRPPMITLTTDQGFFSFPEIDGSGPSDLYVDGAVATMLSGQSIPAGSFPFLHYTPVLVPNAANALPAPVLLPPLDPCNRVVYDGSQDVTLTIRMRDPENPTCDPQTPGCCIPAIEGLEMLVKAGITVRRPDGKCVGPDEFCSGPDDIGQMTLALNQVHHDDVPMPMPDGAAPPFAWTLQPGGSTFDIPVQITYPNMSGLPAGSIAYFLSFDHDANKFQIIATGHVTGDGSSIVTDPGAGLTKAGWGCNCPPYSVTAECKKCKPEITEPALGDTTTRWITTDPQMPSVTCKARVTTAPAESQITFSWTYRIKYDGVAVHTDKTWTGTTTAKGSNETTWQVPFGSDIYGGDVTISVQASFDGKTCSLSIQPYKILALNPSTSDIAALVGASPWYATRIPDAESNCVQFTSAGTPLENALGDGGVGVMQITPAVPESVIWNWRDNVAAGKTKISQCTATAATFWSNQVSQFNMWNAAHPNNQVAPPQNVPCGASHFGFSSGYSFADAIAIKHFNGAAGHYISWCEPQFPACAGMCPAGQDACWVFNSGPNNYVQLVCNQDGEYVPSIVEGL